MYIHAKYETDGIEFNKCGEVITNDPKNESQVPGWYAIKVPGDFMHKFFVEYAPIDKCVQVDQYFYNEFHKITASI